jgi:hypothetical protein
VNFSYPLELKPSALQAVIDFIPSRARRQMFLVHF